MISVLTFVSSFAHSMVQVLLGTGAIYIVIVIMGYFKKLVKYLPTKLTDSAELFAGVEGPSDHIAAVVITMALSVIFVGAAIVVTDKRQL